MLSLNSSIRPADFAIQTSYKFKFKVKFVWSLNGEICRVK